MRSIICLLAVLVVAPIRAESVFIPRMYDTESPVLGDGEMALVIDEDTGLVRAIRHGDGVTPGGVTWMDKSFVLRTSPIRSLSSADLRITLGGSAVYTNGLISMFPSTSTYSSNAIGIATVSVVSASLRLISVTPASISTNALVSVAVDDSGLIAVVTAQHASFPAPGGGTLSFMCAIESFSATAYADPDSVGSTQDMRGVTVLVPHADSTTSATNDADYMAASKGWVEGILPAAVGLWSDYPASSLGIFRSGLRFTDDILPTVKGFNVSYGVNGFLTLSHAGSTGTVGVMSIEAIDPVPYIASFSLTNGAGELLWSTNGVFGEWGVQTCVDLVVADWTNAVILSTNEAPAGYMSMTASNSTWTSGPCFFRAVAAGESSGQQEAMVRFTPPVMAPRFEFEPGVYLFWSNSALWVHSGGSNGLVGVTW